MKGSERSYSTENIDDMIFMFDTFGDCTECDADSLVAVSYINMEINFIPGELA